MRPQSGLQAAEQQIMLYTGKLPGNVDSADLVGARVHRDDGTTARTRVLGGGHGNPRSGKDGQHPVRHVPQPLRCLVINVLETESHGAAS
jgi:hypothetical protein